MKHSFLFILYTLFIASTISATDWNVYIAQYKHDRTCAISYTFDDGLVEHYTLAAPQLERRGLRGTFFINGSKINESSKNPADTTRLNWSQVKEMANNGHEISNHGWAHKNFAKFPIEEIKEDIYKNDSAIFACNGIVPRTFAYPNNNKKKEGRRIAVKNRVGTRTEQRSIGRKATSEVMENWVNSLIETKAWGVGMTHGLTYGYDAFRNPQRLWEHFDKVKAQESKIWVGTFREVASYIKEKEATSLQIIRKKKQLRITPTLKLDKEIYTELLTMVITGERLKIIKKIKVKQGKKKLPIQVQDNKVLFEFNPFGGTILINFPE